MMIWMTRYRQESPNTLISAYNYHFLSRYSRYSTGHHPTSLVHCTPYTVHHLPIIPSIDLVLLEPLQLLLITFSTSQLNVRERQPRSIFPSFVHDMPIAMIGSPQTHEEGRWLRGTSMSVFQKVTSSNWSRSGRDWLEWRWNSRRSDNSVQRK